MEALITLLDLSKVVFRRIKFNFAWAMVYNMIALPVAAGVLYPVGGRQIRLDPVWASKLILSYLQEIPRSLCVNYQDAFGARSIAPSNVTIKRRRSKVEILLT